MVTRDVSGAGQLVAPSLQLSGDDEKGIVIMKRKRLLLFGGVVVLLAIAGIPATWYALYLKGLRPTLLFSLPREECKDLSFGPHSHITSGKRVEELCRKQGVSGGPLFACLGHKVMAFRLMRFHSVYGALEYEQADLERVYFYKYHPRYERGVVARP
jgi:hypothetical protein